MHFVSQGIILKTNAGASGRSFIAENFVKIFKKTNKIFKKDKDINIKNLEKSITEKIGLSVLIKNNKKNYGSITFDYKDIDQLNKIIEIIKLYY